MHYQWRTQDLAKGATTGGLRVKPPAAGGQGAQPPATNDFLRFSRKRTLIFAHFFIEKGHAVMQSLWTMLKYFRSLCLKAEAC